MPTDSTNAIGRDAVQAPVAAPQTEQATDIVAGKEPNMQRCGECHTCRNKHLKKGCLRKQQLQPAAEALAGPAVLLSPAELPEALTVNVKGPPVAAPLEAGGVPATAGAMPGPPMELGDIIATEHMAQAADANKVVWGHVKGYPSWPVRIFVSLLYIEPLQHCS